MPKAKSKRDNAAKVSEKIIEFFTNEVRDLSLDEYAKVIDIVGLHIDNCEVDVKEDMRRN